MYVFVLSIIHNLKGAAYSPNGFHKSVWPGIKPATLRWESWHFNPVANQSLHIMEPAVFPPLTSCWLREPRDSLTFPGIPLSTFWPRCRTCSPRHCTPPPGAGSCSRSHRRPASWPWSSRRGRSPQEATIKQRSWYWLIDSLNYGLVVSTRNVKMHSL